MELKDQILKLSQTYFNEVREIRRHIHANPELSFEEFETSKFICEKLDEWGISYEKGFVKTGVLAIIDTKKPGKTIALRADMDALPIQETTEYSFASKNDKVMHACGHDVHTSSLLGVAKILNELKENLTGKVLLIFQPAEERTPGGARLMMEDGLFDKHSPDLVVAQHVYTDLEVGRVGLKPGKYMASSDELFITIKGKGGHGALPERIIDPVLMASQVIVALQQIVSRNAKPGLPTVLSFGKVIADGSVNVIPDEVKIEGTLRTMDEEWRYKVHELMQNIIHQTTSSMGGSAEIEIRKGYPALVNDPDLTEKISGFSKEYLGEENVEALDIRMTAEDFAYFSQKYPSVMYRLGITSQGEEPTLLHTSNFKVDEDSLRHGMGLMSWLAVQLLQ